MLRTYLYCDWLLIFFSIAFLSWAPASSAAVPQSVGYQGYLTDNSGTVINGPTNITFSIYNVEVGGTALWTDTLSLNITNGLATTSLGRPGNPLPPGLFEAPLYLGVTVAADPEMAPRLAFTATGFALKAADSDTLQGHDANSLDQSTHLGDVANPHGVTAAQAGAITESRLHEHHLNVSSHHSRYTDAEAIDAVKSSDGSGSGFNADQLDGLQASDFLLAPSPTGVSRLRFANQDSPKIDYWDTPGAGRYGVELTAGRVQHWLGKGGRFDIGIQDTVGQFKPLAFFDSLGLQLLGSTRLRFANQDSPKIDYWDTPGAGRYGVELTAGRVQHWLGKFGRFDIGIQDTTGQFKPLAFLDSLGLQLLGDNGYRNVWLSYEGGSNLNRGYISVNDDLGAPKGKMVVTSNNVGDLQLFGPNGRNVRLSNSSSSLDRGFVGVYDTVGDSKASMIVNAASAGAIELLGQNKNQNIWMTNHVSSANHGYFAVANSAGNAKVSMYVDASGSGRINTDVLTILGGSDIAEPFQVTSEMTVRPGMVVSIDPARPGKLRVANDAYDPTVAGIISGAGGVNPGITLTQNETIASGDHPVALTGRVYVYVDAEAAGPVKPGDMLTTSATPGHAMKATNRSRAFGATIGKAMTPLDSGTGLVLVLVSLQ